MSTNNLSVYIHIPFCERKCDYCAFTSFCAPEAEKEKYINFLVSEIEKSNYNGIVDTVYIGGGTPSLISCQEIEKIFDALNKKFSISENAEITIEANPNSITEEKLKKYKACGVNRISIGIQSLSDKSLANIGRLHNRQQAIDAVKMVSKYFNNYSVDLIVGLEGEYDICAYAKELVDLNVKHISCYMLEIYNSTPLGKKVKNKLYTPLKDDEVVESYEKLVAFLNTQNFEQYEISNFAKKGYESKHNLSYWALKNYVGFGCSAHSYYDGKRFNNPDSLIDYYSGKINIEDETQEEKIIENIMLGLRCYLGVDKKALLKLNYDITKNQNYIDFVNDNILYETDERFYLNKKYYNISDYVIKHLI